MNVPFRVIKQDHDVTSYISNSLHLARKYPRIFVHGHYLFQETNSFPRAKLEENCELWGTDNVQGQISEHIFKVKWGLLCLLSFKYISQDAEFWKLGNITRIFPSFSWGIFSHVTRLDQSCASENIWWIIIIVTCTDQTLLISITYNNLPETGFVWSPLK